MDVQHLSDPNQQEGQHLPAEAAEPDGGAELPILDSAHHTGDVVHDHEDQQRIEQARNAEHRGRFSVSAVFPYNSNARPRQPADLTDRTTRREKKLQKQSLLIFRQRLEL